MQYRAPFTSEQAADEQHCEVWQRTELLVDDEIVVDKEHARMTFWRDGRMLRSRHCGANYPSVNGIVLQFSAMTHEEARSSALFGASFARLSLRDVDFEASHFALAPWSQDSGHVIETLELGDILEIDLRGIVRVLRSPMRLARLGQASSDDSHTTWTLFPFSCDAEALGIGELVSTITRKSLTRIESDWPSVIRLRQEHAEAYVPFLSKDRPSAFLPSDIRSASTVPFLTKRGRTA